MKHFLTLVRTLFNIRREFICIFLWIAMIGVIMMPQSLFAQVVAKNHYKTWMFLQLPFPPQYDPNVTVQDQFMRENILLTGIEFLSNPVLKVHEGRTFPIVNPNDHLTWYRAVGRDTLIRVKYENQFEVTTATITSAEYLLVPTKKAPHPPPERLDHYKAYRITDPKPFRTQVMLQDQFDIRYGFPENIDSLVPTYFLTPALKNMPPPMYDSVTHYVAYQIFPNRFFPIEVWTMDQFGEHILSVKNSWFLMVPTTKFLLGSIEGYKFHDYNGNGIREIGDNGLKDWYISLNGPVNKVTQTDVNGHYKFSDLPSGDYNLTEDNQTGWNQTFPPHPGNHSVTLDVGENLAGLDFGNCRDSIFITGYKYNDMDGDGVLDPEDVPLSGWVIDLRDSLRHKSYQTTTNENGYFEFTHLLPGIYVKKEILQPGWVATAPPGIDEGIILTLFYDDTTDREIILNFKTICVRGVKFHDHNRNGRRDAEDEGLGGWTIRLTGHGSVVTNETGGYSFCGIGPGTYRLCEDVMPGWIPSCDTCYTFDAISGGELWFEFCNYIPHACPKWEARFNKKVEGMGFKIPTDAKLMTRNLAIRDTGDIYICGYSDGWGTKKDYVTVKYDEYPGIPIWERRYNNGAVNKDDKAYALTIDKAGNVYVTGESDGGTTKMDILTIKYNAAGDSQWIARYSGTGKDAGYAIAVNKEGTIVYVTGETDGGKAAKSDLITLAYNAFTGVQLGVDIYNGPGSKVDKGYAIDVDVFGFPVVTGESDGGATKPDYVTIKYNPGLPPVIPIWINRYDGPVSKKDYAFAIKTDEHANVFVTGASEGENTKFDYATLAYTPGGLLFWVPPVARFDKIFKNDFGYDLALDANGDVYVTGASTTKDTKLDYATLKYSGLTGWTMWATENRYDGIRKNDIARSVVVCDAESTVFVTGSSDQGAGRKLDYVTLKITLVTGNTYPAWPGRYNGPGLKNDIAYNVAVRPEDCCVVLTGTSDGGKVTKMDFATIQGPSSAPVPGPITTPAVYDGESEDEDGMPTVFALRQNYPNPFNPITTIAFELPEEAFVSLSVYNILGQELVKVLDNELMDSGIKEAEFDASNLASGVYFYRLNAVGTGTDEETPSKSFIKVMKMLLLK